MYSQNNEDDVIAEYFKLEAINVLSIGENDGITLSNVYRIIQENKCNAFLIEPSKKAYDRLLKAHPNNDKVFTLNACIGNEDGKTDFYESSEHLGRGDVALLSTAKLEELNRWTGVEFNKYETDVITFKTLISMSPLKRFDLISIDAEGFDFDILRQIDLTEIGCRMLIIESNGKNEDFECYCAAFNMKLFAKNNENLIFVR